MSHMSLQNKYFNTSSPIVYYDIINIYLYSQGKDRQTTFTSTSSHYSVHATRDGWGLEALFWGEKQGMVLEDG